MLWTQWCYSKVCVFSCLALSIKHFYSLSRTMSIITFFSAWRNEEQIHVLPQGSTLKLQRNDFHMFPLASYAVLGQMLVCVYWHYTGMLHGMLRDAYRAGTSIHRGLIEGLTHGEGDVGSADARRCLDGQTLSLLSDFHCRAGGRCHRNLPQENIHTCSHKKCCACELII